MDLEIHVKQNKTSVRCQSISDDMFNNLYKAWSALVAGSAKFTDSTDNFPAINTGKELLGSVSSAPAGQLSPIVTRCLSTACFFFAGKRSLIIVTLQGNKFGVMNHLPLAMLFDLVPASCKPRLGFVITGKQRQPAFDIP